MTASAFQQIVTVTLSLGLIVVGALAFVTDAVGPLPTNLWHGVALNILPGLVGLAAWRFHLGGLFLFLFGWLSCGLGVYGLLDGPRWLYPFFNMSLASSSLELGLGVAALAIHGLAPELLPLVRRPRPDSMRTVALEGTEVAYVDEGKGEPVVLLHGYPQNHHAWDAPAGWLRKKYRVIAVDFPGWGRSAAAGADDEVPFTDAERLRELLDHLALDSVNLFTHDYGGLVGLAFVQRHPERVRRFAIANSRAHRYFPPPLAAATAVMNWMGRIRGLRVLGALLPLKEIHHAGMLKYVRRGCFSHDAIEDYLAPMATWRGRWSLLQFFAIYPTAATQRLADGLAEIRCPVAVIWGDEDPYCPFHIARDLAARVPHATLHRLEGAEHFSIEERPTRVETALRDLLDKAPLEPRRTGKLA